MSKDFPKHLYVVRQEEGKHHWFEVQEAIENHAEDGTRKIVAVYKLDETVKVDVIVRVR